MFAAIAASGSCAPLTAATPGTTPAARPQTPLGSAHALLADVCLPFVMDGRQEAEVIANRRFHRRPHSALSTEDIRFHHYSTSYAGIRLLTTYEGEGTRRCLFDLPNARDDPRAVIEAALKGRGETWAQQSMQYGIPEVGASYTASTVCWRPGDADIEVMESRYGWSVEVKSSGRCQR
jgi:hypothetical protein